MPDAPAQPDAPRHAGAAPHATEQTTRRRFLGRFGAGALAVAAGCRETTDPLARTSLAAGTPLAGLNLVYACAQLTADFYARAAGNPYLGGTINFVGMTGLELNALLGIASHKNAQKNALAQLIPSNRISDVLLFDFTSVDFSSRASVLGLAERLEDVGVAAANGAVSTLQNAADATLVAKIAANWARHAAVVRDLIDVAAGNANTAGRTGFAATTDAATGLDQTADTAAVIAAIKPYLRTQLTLS